jgi:hypothetical protein
VSWEYGNFGVLLIRFSWFVVGQIFASVALQKLSAQDPYEFRVPIYTQVRGALCLSFIFHCQVSH